MSRRRREKHSFPIVSPEAVMGLMQFIILAEHSDCDCITCAALRRSGKEMAESMKASLPKSEDEQSG